MDPEFLKTHVQTLQTEVERLVSALEQIVDLADLREPTIYRIAYDALNGLEP